MCLTRYRRLTKNVYYQVSEFIGHEFRKSVNEKEYEILAKPRILGNTTYNDILERIHPVIVVSGTACLNRQK